MNLKNWSSYSKCELILNFIINKDVEGCKIVTKAWIQLCQSMRQVSKINYFYL